MNPDNELKEIIQHKIQEVFSSTLKSARQKGEFSGKGEAKLLDLLHVVVEEAYRAELARERQEQHKKDNLHPALLKERQELRNKLHLLDGIISGLAQATFPDHVDPSSRPRKFPGPFSAHPPKRNPALKPGAISSASRQAQWQENERRRMQESSYFRVIEEAVRQIESNRQRQWSDWTRGRTAAPVPIVKELEDILKGTTRAVVSPPSNNNPGTSAPSPLKSVLKNSKTSSSSPVIQHNGSKRSGTPDGVQLHCEVAGGPYHTDIRVRIHCDHAKPTVWTYAPKTGPHTLPMVEKPIAYSTSSALVEARPNKPHTKPTGRGSRDGAIQPSGSAPSSAKPPSSKFWHPGSN